MILKPNQLGRALDQGSMPDIAIVWGSEPVLLTGCKALILNKLEAAGAQIERLSFEELDLQQLCENAQLTAFFGATRAFVVEDFEPESLSSAQCDMICGLFASLPEQTCVVLVCRVDALNERKGVRSKKLLAAAKNALLCRADSLSPAELKSYARRYCERKGHKLSGAGAVLLAQRCAGGLGVLKNDCDKLCAYAPPGGEISCAMIDKLCRGDLSGDLYGLAGLLLKGNLGEAFDEINRLVLSKEPVSRILGSLGLAFSDLARAKTARNAGKNAGEVFSKLGFRYEWQAQRAYRDCAKADEERLNLACEIICGADLKLKTGVGDERALLDGCVLMVSRALGGNGI
jgi:DNA polymerase-3 subunit delta